MSFSNIKIPDSFGISDEDLIPIETIAKKHRESTPTYVAASVCLVSLWGEVVKVCEFSPHMVHGIGYPEDEDMFSFDIPGFVDENTGLFQKREEAALEMGFVTSDLAVDEVHRFSIDDDIHAGLQVAQAFFGRGIRPLIGLALDLRNQLLDAQPNGGVYMFAQEPEAPWYEVPISNYPDTDLV